ncbi:MAG: oligosaccharyl transferase, archaeosortase system-associated [Proteobacteria bacterium]|nr:oligosaccharyl transferase, archaeosortase system-associated [Pseudomonadota bacterium]
MNSKQGALSAALSGLGLRARVVFAAALGLLVVGLVAVNRLANLGPDWGDPDSMMRLVEVRDLLSGQGWFDLTQYRLDPPGGVLMHWSRLVDVPIVGLIFAANPFVGRAGAELFAANLWPVLLVIPFAFALASVAGRFGGDIARLVTLLMIFLSPPVKGIFLPGDLDHHNIQAVLLACVLMGLVRADGARRWPLAAGLAAAISLAVGLETLLAILLAILGLAIAWTIDADRWRRGLMLFNTALIAGTLFTAAVTIPPSLWLVPACDALSFAYLTPVLFGGGAVIALAAVLRGHGDGLPGLLMRGGALVAVASLLVTVAAILFPTCLAGPYGDVDPAIRPIWLDRVAEAQGLIATLEGRPGLVPPLYLAPLAAFVLGALALRRMPAADRPAFAIVLSILGGSVLLGAVQLRALVGAQIVASAAVGVVVALAVRATAGRDDARSVARRWSWLVAVPMLWMLAVMAANRLSDRPDLDAVNAATMTECRAFFGDVLGNRTPGLVVATSNFGAFLLKATPHAVLAAPYHRNAHGILAVEAVFTGADPEAAFRATGATYLAACTGDAELRQMAERAPAGLAAQLIEGVRPTWLAEVSSGPAGVILSARPSGLDVTGSLPVLRLRPSIRE